MKRRLQRLTACFLAAGMSFSAAGLVAYADGNEAEETADLTGQMAFAQCKEYINVRSEASTDGEVVAKIYNNGSATILEQDGDWYRIQSGNAVGYVKAEYFATGDEADEIAQKVAYNVAVVYPEVLNVRQEASTDSATVTVAYSSDELEVVDYQGDWMKVALGDDVYGYVNAYYVESKTYYPVAETLEEEQARLAAEQKQRASEEHDQETGSEDTSYAEYTNTQETSDVQTGSYDENVTDDTYQTPSETETAWTEVPETETTWTEAPETEVTWTEAPETETTWTEAPETETTWTEAPETETTWTEAPETEAPQTETESQENSSAGTDSSVGQSIANYALQFVGNPYVWGGTSLTNGADCSGFTQSVFANFGIGLPRVASDQAYSGTSVDLGSIQAGDLLFYSSGSGIDHVAIYIGNGTIVHAANASSGITTSGAYYSTPVAAVRCW